MIYLIQNGADLTAYVSHRIISLYILQSVANLDKLIEFIHFIILLV